MMSSISAMRRSDALWFFTILLVAIGTRGSSAGIIGKLLGGESETGDAMTILCEKYNCSCPYEGGEETTLDCSNRHINELPKDIALGSSIRRVYFQDNNIKDILEASLYSGLGVLVLDLSHNQIDDIQSKAFSGLEKLEQLFLHHNKLWALPLESFDGLSKLITLDLSYNTLTTIIPDIFKPCTSLRELKLSHNQLMTFHRDTFSQTPALERLEIDNNGIQRLSALTTSFPPNLKRLVLSDNPLEEIPTEALSRAKKLLVLDISGIPISRIKPAEFDGISNLTTLYLNRLPNLEEIPAYAFCGLKSLRRFQCYQNRRLVKIDPDAFRCKGSSQPMNIQELVLRNNAMLKTLSENLLDWNNVTNLDLTENPWRCDCNLKWLNKVRVSKQAVSRIKCEYPERHAGQMVQMINPDEMKCGLNLSEDVLTTLGLLVVVVFCMVITGILVLAYKRACCFRRRSQQGKYVRVVASKDKVDLEWDNTAEP